MTSLFQTTTMEDLSYHDLLDEWITNFFKWCSQGGRRDFHEDMAKLEVACERLSDDQKIPLFLKPDPQRWRNAIGEAVVREEMGVVDIMLSSLTANGLKKLLLHHTEAILHIAAGLGIVKMFKFIFKFMDRKLNRESVMEVLEHKCLLNGTSVMLYTIIGYSEEKEKAQIIDIILDNIPSSEQQMSLLKTELRVTGTSAIHEAVIRGLPNVVLKLLQRLSRDEQREILALETRYGERPADLVFHHTQIPDVYRPETCQQKLNEVGQLLARQQQLLGLQTPDRNNGLLINLLANIAIVEHHRDWGVDVLNTADPQISLRLMVGIWASLGLASATFAILYLVRVNYACL